MSIRTKSNQRWLLGLILLFLGTLLTACGSSSSKAQAEKEIVSFMLDFIVQQEIGGTADYIRSTDQPWVEAPPQANIIVWAPTTGKPEDPSDYLDRDKPIKVWWYAENQLSESPNKSEAIAQYRTKYMTNPATDIWAWGYYEFGIVSVREDVQTAEVYVGASCGPLCGHGFLYTLQRNPTGQWKIIDAQHLWQV